MTRDGGKVCKTNKVERTCNENEKNSNASWKIVSVRGVLPGSWFLNPPRGIKRSNCMPCKGFGMTIHTNVT